MGVVLEARFKDELSIKSPNRSFHPDTVAHKCMDHFAVMCLTSRAQLQITRETTFATDGSLPRRFELRAVLFAIGITFLLVVCCSKAPMAATAAVIGVRTARRRRNSGSLLDAGRLACHSSLLIMTRTCQCRSWAVPAFQNGQRSCGGLPRPPSRVEPYSSLPPCCEWSVGRCFSRLAL
eukprot:5990570-Amphidinium_carterae.1